MQAVRLQKKLSIVEHIIGRQSYETLDRLFFANVPIVDAEVRERFRQLWLERAPWTRMRPPQWPLASATVSSKKNFVPLSNGEKANENAAASSIIIEVQTTPNDQERAESKTDDVRPQLAARATNELTAALIPPIMPNIERVDEKMIQDAPSPFESRLNVPQPPPQNHRVFVEAPSSLSRGEENGASPPSSPPPSSLRTRIINAESKSALAEPAQTASETQQSTSVARESSRSPLQSTPPQQPQQPQPPQSSQQQQQILPSTFVAQRAQPVRRPTWRLDSSGQPTPWTARDERNFLLRWYRNFGVSLRDSVQPPPSHPHTPAIAVSPLSIARLSESTSASPPSVVGQTTIAQVTNLRSRKRSSYRLFLLFAQLINLHLLLQLQAPKTTAKPPSETAQRAAAAVAAAAAIPTFSLLPSVRPPTIVINKEAKGIDRVVVKISV